MGPGRDAPALLIQTPKRGSGEWGFMARYLKTPLTALGLIAAAALAAAPAPPVYARVDMVGDAAGVLHIMELELIEPSLFLHHAADKGAAFGRAVYAAV